VHAWKSGPALEALLLEDTTYFPDADCELEEKVTDQLNSHQILEDIVPLN
jgi:hypothetical protein